MKKYILALDQGTTSSRAIIFDKEQNILGVSQKEFTQIYPNQGWVEHNPLEIWASQYGVLQEVIAKTNITQEEVAAIGITNQRETTIVWDKNTGEPVYNAIVWQCRRTAGIIEELKLDKEFSEYVKENTGLLLDAYFSATKIKWILDNVEGARERAEKGELLFGTVDTWLVWKLTNGKVHVTDYTNASRTMLYNIKELRWDERILEKLNIPKSMLPEVKNSSEVYGYTNLGGTGGVRVPIAGMAGDQQCALFGQTCFEEGSVKNTYGTGCFLLMNTGEKMIHSKNGLVSTIAVGIDGKVQYALEGSVFVGGAVIQWIRDELKLVTDAADTEYFAQKVEDNGGVYVVPAFTGLGAPYWDMYARGAIFGLTRGANRNHIIRAALESIAYQSKDLIDAMQEDAGCKLTRLKVDGGASRNNLLMQFQADITGAEVVRPIITETTALGAAYLAGLAVGFWKSKEEIAEKWAVSQSYSPNLAEEKKEKLYKGWKKAVKRAEGWEEE
ncbi:MULTISPECIES: glycerol kinase GlpK [Clostridium]|jgi:glycerol kinase (EC 2.7.1.30)|uniref:Glycerol kinase n=2 Tax=Clostridium beijerinckii TaxID=1520 RepID=GLPK_CLOB8|nr:MULTISPECIES: glycerol kinase GlpK [Clostridium]A6M1Y8.1 RecName: Full=Glycerol kinase; AltName: Full=ATP:glycerol 3-phosphotransferase; AltName: Full=Glycerokinase; Short=GK [Clostridium beijerinckii NCIMB 8052]ABR36618.1 glycerol kinase [Clostridium beijerinckii NCIMB 8052]AIU00287.1 glycerol kinase [Clostridium beijerinckii ATCC 35702]AJH01565.1 glycerol kinase [Clostridium beijerinckii]ALB44347.1 glycerol kinase [Clostridium beijerinckii NRRL B-598]AQS07365.1 glycerol kinase [Clostridi